jgi:hypothetical protein
LQIRAPAALAFANAFLSSTLWLTLGVGKDDEPAIVACARTSTTGVGPLYSRTWKRSSAIRRRPRRDAVPRSRPYGMPRDHEDFKPFGVLEVRPADPSLIRNPRDAAPISALPIRLILRPTRRDPD